MIAQALQEEVAAGDLIASDIEEYRMTDHYKSSNKIDHMYFVQTLRGIDVYNAVGALHVMNNGTVLTKNVSFVKSLENKIIGGTTPTLTQIQAVEAAANLMSYKITKALTIKTTRGGPSKKVVISDGGISLENIPVELKYVAKGKGIYLAWQVTIYELNAQHYYNIRVNAHTGEMLDKDDMVDECFSNLDDIHLKENTKTLAKKIMAPPPPAPMLMMSPDAYNVYAIPLESAGHGARSIEMDPAILAASPFAWHDTNGSAGAEFTTTQGNNVHAYSDQGNNNAPTPGSSPDGGVTLDFNFAIDLAMAPSTYRDASVTNLFYWNNIIHDVLYLHGFDEVSGNFQVNNYGNGGLGNDDVRAEGQDGGGNCNANFATPSDGSRPRMQMYLCSNTSPSRDGSLDNGVIVHEYGHGVSNRLVGGPGNTSCLNNIEQMGEGWSDYLALIFTMQSGDAGTDARGIGTWLFGEAPNGPGIRPTPYSTDLGVNPTTYADVNSFSVPHGVGYVWSTMLWEMTWGLIDEHGFNPDLTGDWTTGGNNLALRLVLDGMKLTPCSPGFVDGRDAILAADVALTGGANQCIIWKAFAKRGLGDLADQGSSSSLTDGTVDFNIPNSCIFLAEPLRIDLCQPDDAIYTVTVPDGFFNNPVTLSTTGEPAGSVVAFSSNPVTPGNMSTMTVTVGAGVAPGMYTIVITGNDGVNSTTTNVELYVSAGTPSPLALISPLDLTTGELLPTLIWDGSTGATSYLIEIATDPGFTNIVVSEMVGMNSYFFDQALLNMTYYWRVTGTNGCGSVVSDIWEFNTTHVETCATSPSADVPKSVGPNGGTITLSTVVITADGIVSDVNVTNINITHTFSGDLDIDLMSPSGTTVKLHDSECGAFDNIIINFDDEAVSPTYPCPSTDNGFYQPVEPLRAFDGECMTGTWTLIVTDNANLDGGTLNSWTLDLCSIPSQVCYADIDGDGYGDPDTGNAVCGVCPVGQVLNDLDCNDATTDLSNICSEVPTMSQWGLIVLSLLLMIIGIIAVREREGKLA